MGASPIPPLPPVNPVFIAIDVALAAYGVYTAVNNYVKSGSGGAPDINPIPTVPTKKTIAPTRASLKSNLGTYAAAIAGLSQTTVNDTKTAVKTAKESFGVNATKQQTATQSLLSAAGESPLLGNQVHMKDSIDKLIDAINNSTIVSATVFGTLDMNMSSIAASLSAISSTLIDISNNYDEALDNTGDVPYINSNDYYRMLREKGLSFEQANDLARQEAAYVAAIKAGGTTDYSAIKKAVMQWRSQNIDSNLQDMIADDVAGLTKGWHGTTTRTWSKDGTSDTLESVPESSALPSISLELPNIEAWAAAALPVANAMTPSLVARNLELDVGIKEATPPDYVARELWARLQKTEYAVTEATFEDLDGNSITKGSPVAISAMNNAIKARALTDEVNFQLDESDLDDAFMGALDLSSLFLFDKKSERLTSLVSDLGV